MITEILAGGGAVTAVGQIKADSLLGLFYKDLAQPSVQAVGAALGSVLEFSTIPFKYVQLGNEKVKLNIDKHLNSYKEKVTAIPPENLIEVNPQIGVPILDKLSYTTSEDIAALFVNLLANASSSETVNLAHPSFVQLIENLSIDEARIISGLAGEVYVPHVSFHAYLNSQPGYHHMLENGTLLPFTINMLFPDNVAIYLTNLARLGILNEVSNRFKQDEASYKALIEHYQFESTKAAWNESGKYSRFEVVKGYYDITPFGRQFIKACLLDTGNVAPASETSS